MRRLSWMLAAISIAIASATGCHRLLPFGAAPAADAPRAVDAPRAAEAGPVLPVPDRPRDLPRDVRSGDRRSELGAHPDARALDAQTPDVQTPLAYCVGVDLHCTGGIDLVCTTPDLCCDTPSGTACVPFSTCVGSTYCCDDSPCQAFSGTHCGILAPGGNLGQCM